MQKTRLIRKFLILQVARVGVCVMALRLCTSTIFVQIPVDTLQRHVVDQFDAHCLVKS